MAGAWTFASAGTTLDPGFTARPGDTTFRSDPGHAGRFQLELLYLDEDPVRVAPGLEASDFENGPLGRLFAAPLRTITPWEWDWFEARR